MALSEEQKAELVAYSDGELDEQASHAIEAKIATDAEVRAEIDALKQTWGLLDYLPRTPPSPNFTNRTMERLSLEKMSGSGSKPISIAKPRRRWPLALSWAAALLLAVGAGLWAGPYFFPGPAPEPILESDEPLVRHLRIVEKWRFYENVDDKKFLDALAQPDLFGEEAS